MRILDQPEGGDPRREAAAFLNPDAGFADAEAVLAGARDIVAERLSETAALRAGLRALLQARRDHRLSRGRQEQGTQSVRRLL